MIFDFGFSQLQASIFSLKGHTLTTLAHVYSTAISGSYVDNTIFSYLLNTQKQKWIDHMKRSQTGFFSPTNNSRTADGRLVTDTNEYKFLCAQLRHASIELKSLLKSNPNPIVQVELIVNEQEIISFSQRDFDSLFYRDFRAVIRDVNHTAQKQAKANSRSLFTRSVPIHSVQLIGGSSNLPSFRRILDEVYQGLS